MAYHQVGQYCKLVDRVEAAKSTAEKLKSKSKGGIYLDMLELTIFQLNGMVLLFSIDW